MTEAAKTGGLHAKLAEITAELGYVRKDGRNDFQKYNYTSAEVMLSAVRGPLASRGVALIPSLTAISEREYTTSGGKASVITTAHVRFTFVDSESGEERECDWAGQGDDPGDKGLGKAYTNAIKTFLREQFLIPTGDDPEADSSTDARAADRKRSQPSNGGELATPEDVKSMVAAAKDLTPDQVKLALAACGIPDVKSYGQVPRAKTAELAKRLAGIER